MRADWKLDVLTCLYSKLPNASRVECLPRCEKWIASSALQKCVRRGAAELGQRAAITFFKLDKPGLWRRLISIAFEDIGAADIDALIETVAIATATEWRTQVGEERALAYLVQRLSDAPKDRSADYLMLAAHHHASLAHMRQTCATSSIETRLNLLTDLSRSLPERAVAAWFLSGLDERYEKIVGRGDLPALKETYRALGASDLLCTATMAAARRTREPFNILVPLVWLEIQRNSFSTVRDDPLPHSPVIDGLPLCALDEHTRPGKQAINRLVAEDSDLRACLQQFVRKPRWSAAAQHAAFYVDGSPVTPRLDWSQSHSLEALGTEADIGRAEVPSEGVRPLVEAVRAGLDRLNKIRCEIWDGLRADPEYPLL
jgi:hypothetical protein